MSRAIWDHLLETAEAAHANPALADFTPFPSDLREASIAPARTQAAGLMENDATLAEGLHPLGRAFLEASPHAAWYSPYHGRQDAPALADSFGCYCLIGSEGRNPAPYLSEQMAAYVAYLAPGAHYPWHHHSGEELYMVLGGEAEFLREGEDPAVLSPGQSVEHASMQPHAMTTRDRGVMAYVVWRKDLAALPEMSEGASA